MWTMSGPILAQSWLDNKAVYFLSTIHKPEHPADTPQGRRTVKRRGGQGNRGVDVPCPPLLHDYNIGMGGVDFNDRQRKYYNMGRRSCRWYRRIFFYLLEVVLHNTSVVMWEALPNDRGRKGDPLDFRVNLVSQLVGGTRAPYNVGRPRSVDIPRLSNVGIHLPMVLEKVLVCKVCSKKLSDAYSQRNADVPKEERPKKPYVPRTRFSCQECKVPLCISEDKNCFKDWHTKAEYWR